MEITLTQGQLAIVADRLNKLKIGEIDLKTEKARLDDFILGVITSNGGVIGDVSWELKEGKLLTKEIEQETKG